MKLPPPFKFLLIATVPVLVGWRPLLKTFSLAWQNEAYTHILLILPIALAMVYLEWPTVQAQLAPGWRAAFVLMAAAVALAAYGQWKFTADVQLAVEMLAVVLWWVGAFIGCFGARVSKSLIFPLCFLFWMVPFPTSLVNAIISLLQQGSAYAAQWMFTMVGVPVWQNGIRLTIPGLTVEVAQECSSIRSSLILFVTTMVLAQVFLRSSWRKALVIVVAVPLSVAKNGLRIFTIAMLGTHVDPGFLTGRLHRHGGVIFLAIAIAVIFLLLWILRDEPETGGFRSRALPAAK